MMGKISVYAIPGIITGDKLKVLRDQVSRSYGLTERDLVKRTRIMEIRWPRQVYHYLATRYGSNQDSYRVIAASTGLTHSTIVNSISRVINAAHTDKGIKAEVLEISARCADFYGSSGAAVHEEIKQELTWER